MGLVRRIGSLAKRARVVRWAREALARSASANTGLLRSWTGSFDADRLVARAARPDQQPEPGVIKNFIGVKLRPAIMPSVLEPMAGTVEGPPDPGNWHADIAEWGAAFHAVDESGPTFRMVELGCGWGCWMVNTGAYARQHGKTVDLVGIEGNEYHLANARLTLEDNGFGSGDYRLYNGVAAPREGVAMFPKPDPHGEDWGAEAVFYPDQNEQARLLATGRYISLRCYTLADLLPDGMADLLHVDIQGAEVDFVQANAAHVAKLVRRVLIGTHSRIIEGKLMQHFLDAGWELEMDRPLISKLRQGRPVTVVDGVQMWRNPNL